MLTAVLPSSCHSRSVGLQRKSSQKETQLFHWKVLLFGDRKISVFLFILVAQDPSFCTLCSLSLYPPWPGNWPLLPSLPLHVNMFKSYPPFRSHLKCPYLATCPNLSTRDRASTLVSPGWACGKDIPEALSGLVSISIQCASIFMSLFFPTRL